MFCCCCFIVESCCVSAHRMCVGCGMWTPREARECRGLGVHAFKSGDSGLGFISLLLFRETLTLGSEVGDICCLVGLVLSIILSSLFLKMNSHYWSREYRASKGRDT